MTTHIARAAAATFVAGLALAACGADERPPPASPSTATTTVPTSPLDGALWPDPATATAQDGPRDVARSFLETFVGFEHPPLGDFAQGDARSGEVPVLRRREDGAVVEDKVIATIGVRQLDGSRWFVVFAASDEVKLSSPRAGPHEALATIASPVKVAGEGAGFEGNVVLRVHAAFDPTPIVEAGVQAGSTTIEPFSADLAFDPPRTATGAIVARAGSGLAGAEPFEAIPVRFGGG